MSHGIGDGPHLTLGRWFRDIRLAAGFRSQPQAELHANNTGLRSVTQGKLSYTERGWNPAPDPQLLHDLSKLYDVPYEDLVSRCVEAHYGVEVRPAKPGEPRQETRVQPDLTTEDQILVNLRKIAEKRGRLAEFMKFAAAAGEVINGTAATRPARKSQRR